MAKKVDRDAVRVQAQLSRNLRRLMAEDGRTCDDLDADASVASKTVWRLVSGRGLPSTMTLLRLCAALGCTPDDMLEGCGDMVRTRPIWRVVRGA